MTRIAAVIALTLCLFAGTAVAEDNPYLESIGALGASSLYTAYSYIGVTADAFAGKVYKAKQVRSMMTEVDGMLANVAKYLGKVSETNIAATDKEFLAKMLTIVGLLRTEAKDLVLYAGTAAEADAQTFERSRQAAWTQLSQLLGIKQ